MPIELLQIIEAKVVNEQGKPTPIRKVPPREWAEKFKEVFKPDPGSYREKQKLPENNFCIPGLFKQTKIFFIRDILSKIADKQYVLISVLGAPLLALLLAYFTRSGKGGDYLFSDNQNIPAYLFMCVITSLFLGLIMSAEEIVKDRKILKRESFLNLSWFSYLNSKIMIVFTISAIQTLSFILIGNAILGIKGMTLSYWLILFTTSCLANLLGLNVSAAFSSVITVYIIIPFILIPQLLFSGALVKYENLNKSTLSSYEYVPVIGDLMAARWSFEALAIQQFKSNKYERNFFHYNVEIAQNEWYADFLIDELKKDLWRCMNYKDSISYRNTVNNSFDKLNFHINQLTELAGFSSVPEVLKTSLALEKFSVEINKVADQYLDSLERQFKHIRNYSMALKDSVEESIKASVGIEEFRIP